MQPNNVAKYLYFLDKERVRPELLLMKRPLVDHLRVVEEEYGIGYSGMLHKMEKNDMYKNDMYMYTYMYYDTHLLTWSCLV